MEIAARTGPGPGRIRGRHEALGDGSRVVCARGVAEHARRTPAGLAALDSPAGSDSEGYRLTY